MTNTTVLITDMAILAVIFLLGTLAKIFPKSGRKTDSNQGSGFRDQGSVKNSQFAGCQLAERGRN